MSSSYPQLAAKVASSIERTAEQTARRQELARVASNLPAAGQPVTSVEQQAVAHSISPGAATMLGAPALVALGSLLPWATATTPFGSISKDGTSGDGVITLILAAIAILSGILCLYGEKNKNGWAGLGAVVFLLAGAASIYDMSSLPIPATNLVIVSVGIGLWLCVIGAIVGLIAACVAMYTASEAPIVIARSGISATTNGTPPAAFEPANELPPKPPGAGVALSTSVADELTKLATLKADGVLTDDEFGAQKAKLLS
jgi:hypothetical protein